MANGKGIIGDNLKAFLGGYAASFVALFKPLLLDTSAGTGQGVLLVVALWFLKLIGLTVISFATGFASSLGADIFKRVKLYFKEKTKTSENDRSESKRNGRAA